MRVKSILKALWSLYLKLELVEGLCIVAMASIQISTTLSSEQMCGVRHSQNYSKGGGVMSLCVLSIVRFVCLVICF